MTIKSGRQTDLLIRITGIICIRIYGAGFNKTCIICAASHSHLNR
jgi:hypothetical protein